MAMLVNAINKFTASKAGKFLTGIKAPCTLATITTLSCVSKDAVNCAFYTWQSCTNKRIPDDKRNFVAGLDLSNGILNVTLQLGAGLLFDKVVFPKLYDDFIGKKCFEKLPQKLVEKYKDLSLAKAEQHTKLLNKLARNGLMVIGTLVLTQILVKRVLVPSIATPMATYFKEKFDKNHPKQINAQQPQGDVVTFENRSENVTNSQENQNLPDCYKTFVK
ncbi:MAG: hypothetical protein MJ180_06450 [Candidatus Gastranaerophilales bacterium]|nr:hypothetical protein [Candidatus Gastranaerophilales bacterium]